MIGLFIIFENQYSRVWSNLNSFISFVERGVANDRHLTEDTKIIYVSYSGSDAELGEFDLDTQGLRTCKDLADWLQSSECHW